ncbi:MAG: DEAD/DEAH box helicase [Candidatus Wildermuthbacteria bacterium]|nr:DEAD/DEAH box helicase [Candidatus Wildermuthbacteria bacterium]
MDLSRTGNNLLIVAITPYFLEKGNVWFQENIKDILEARKTQQFFQENTRFLEKNQRCSLSELLRKLDELGYEKVFQVRDPGEFIIKGGIIEVFPINTDNAFRIEFAGNTIEEIEKLEISIADEKKSKEILKKRLKSQKLFSDLKGLKEGDFLVHLDHGVGIFRGLKTMREITYYLLEYASEDKLYIPLGLERKLSRYIGFENPRVSRLSSPFWIKTKRRIREEVEKLAREILDLYAKREIATRPPYHPEGEISKHIEGTFPYQETPDQLQALEDIRNDLESPHPMDRIVCGDVGFGKTEIALRAMVYAAEQGYQTALLAPTTILAYQHFQHFTERLKRLPVKVALLSRLAPKERKVLDEIQKGQIDIVIGTHRLLSPDVKFHNLGLLVIDDEQKFGVKQKEKLKGLRTSLDTLSLSATPIPRTLYMALSSLKKVSLVQTPPLGRVPVSISLAKWNKDIVQKAIREEIKRKGQVYYLHNRIGTLAKVEALLQKLVPGLEIGTVHGRLRETAIIKTMERFREKKCDLLLATTIIENGLDLPNVNTIIVSSAENLGLSQAYQLRGRIGRSEKKAYAYFLHGSKLTEKAKLRLQALKQAQELGSGYSIALKDLEIRGAGNILGKEQSGSLNAIGLNLYCQMLSEAVEKMRNA